MSEYIVDVDDKVAEIFVERFDWETVTLFGHHLVGEIVRCKECKHYYEPENYHPSGNYVMRCCKYFDTYNDEVEPDGFCAWGERRER